MRQPFALTQLKLVTSDWSDVLPHAYVHTYGYTRATPLAARVRRADVTLVSLRDVTQGRFRPVMVTSVLRRSPFPHLFPYNYRLRARPSKIMMPRYGSINGGEREERGGSRNAAGQDLCGTCLSRSFVVSERITDLLNQIFIIGKTGSTELDKYVVSK